MQEFIAIKCESSVYSYEDPFPSLGRVDLVLYGTKKIAFVPQPGGERDDSIQLLHKKINDITTDTRIANRYNLFLSDFEEIGHFPISNSNLSIDSAVVSSLMFGI